MMELLFKGVFDAEWMAVLGLKEFLLCLTFSLILGLVIAFCHMYRSVYSQSFVITLALLPSVVCVVIMLVNGNIGAGVAVAGAFSLVRFRSAAGTAKEICTLFFAMGAGLICGMGYLGFATVFTLILSAMFVLYNRLGFGLMKKSDLHKTLRITIPEDLDYTGVFDDIFAAYTRDHSLISVKTTNMGSLFKLTYELVLTDPSKEKEMIDMLRVRNGNLEISISKTMVSGSEM
mgnify:CR=1 FL=1